ncbi:hypothetical protein HDU67_003568 [Dinochytrium kinnereticum]|nr:hypothetical protein HDU67_003568 [Dinochytrium kinnereticum]
MTISSLELVSEDGGPFSIEAGWGQVTNLSGAVRVLMSKHLKDPKVMVEFFGESETLWTGEKIRDPQDKKPTVVGPRRLIKRTIHVSPAQLMMPTHINRFLILPFSISLPELDGGDEDSENDEVGFYAGGSGDAGGASTVWFCMLINQNHLLYQEPYNAEKVMYTLMVPRRSLCIGEAVDLQINILNMPPGNFISSIMVALNTVIEFRGKGTVPVTLAPLATVCDDSWEMELQEMMKSNKLPNWKRSYRLVADKDLATSTLDSPLISVKHLLRLEIRLLAQSTPNVSVEVPIVLVPPWEEATINNNGGVWDGSAVPQNEGKESGPASASNGGAGALPTGETADLQAIPLNGGKTLQIVMPNQSVVCADYDPVVPDELELRIGDIVILNMVHDDGWAHGTNITTNESGMLPLAILQKDDTIPIPSPHAVQEQEPDLDDRSDAFSFTHTIIELIGPPKPPQENRFQKYAEAAAQKANGGMSTQPMGGVPKSYFGPVTMSVRVPNGRAAPIPTGDDEGRRVGPGLDGSPQRLGHHTSAEAGHHAQGSPHPSWGQDVGISLGGHVDGKSTSPPKQPALAMPPSPYLPMQGFSPHPASPQSPHVDINGYGQRSSPRVPNQFTSPTSSPHGPFQIYPLASPSSSHLVGPHLSPSSPLANLPSLSPSSSGRPIALPPPPRRAESRPDTSWRAPSPAVERAVTPSAEHPSWSSTPTFPDTRQPFTNSGWHEQRLLEDLAVGGRPAAFASPLRTESLQGVKGRAPTLSVLAVAKEVRDSGGVSGQQNGGLRSAESGLYGPAVRKEGAAAMEGSQYQQPLSKQSQNKQPSQQQYQPPLQQPSYPVPENQTTPDLISHNAISDAPTKSGVEDRIKSPQDALPNPSRQPNYPSHEVTLVPLKPPAEDESPQGSQVEEGDGDDLYVDYLDYWLAGTVSTGPSEDSASESNPRFSRPISAVSSAPSRKSIAPRPPSSVLARRAPSSGSARSGTDARLSAQSGTSSQQIPTRRSSSGATLISAFNLIYGSSLVDGGSGTSLSSLEPMLADTLRGQRIPASWVAPSGGGSATFQPVLGASRVRAKSSLSAIGTRSVGNNDSLPRGLEALTESNLKDTSTPRDFATPVLPPMDFGGDTLLDLGFCLGDVSSFGMLIPGPDLNDSSTSDLNLSLKRNPEYVRKKEILGKLSDLDDLFAGREITGEQYFSERNSLMASMGVSRGVDDKLENVREDVSGEKSVAEDINNVVADTH